MPQTGDLILTSKYLVLQSKRMLLSRAQVHPGDHAQVEVERLEKEVSGAHERYSAAVLRWGVPATAEYRLIAYASLIARGERLKAALAGSRDGLAPDDRREVMEDISTLERIIEGWRDVTRQSMAGAVA